jgi:ketosteroid isomerase-like protein
MRRCLLRVTSGLALLAFLPARVPGQAPTRTSSAVVTEIRDAVRRYDVALRRADVAALGQFFAPEYTFVNARGQRLTRAERLANVTSGRTAFDSLAHVPQEDYIRQYGEVVVYTTLLTIGGRYSGKPQQGQFRALVLWVRRDGRWQQIASQMTAVAAP